MPKKFFIPTLISVATCTMALTAPVSAETTIGGVTYWEYEDLESISKEIAITKATVCNGQWQCEDYISRAYAATLGGKYYAVESFSQQNFMITAVNPNNHTMRIRFFKEHQGGYSSPLKKLRIFWWPGSESHSSTFPDALDNDATAVIIYSEASDSEGFETLLSGQEVEISVPEEFFTTGSRIIRFMLEYDVGYGYGGRNLSNYLGEALPEGQEYRAAFDNQGNTQYIPLEIITPEQNEKNETNNVPDLGTQGDEFSAPVTPTTAAQSTKYIYQTVTVKSPDETSASIETGNDEVAVTEDAAPLAEDVAYPLAGDSVDHYNADGDYFEFPWWILALIAAGIVTFSWFFAKKPKKV